jgi:hypothetical protein
LPTDLKYRILRGELIEEWILFRRHSEERVWLAKYTILQIASLGVTPNTPNKKRKGGETNAVKKDVRTVLKQSVKMKRKAM